MVGKKRGRQEGREARGKGVSMVAADPTTCSTTTPGSKPVPAPEPANLSSAIIATPAVTMMHHGCDHGCQRAMTMATARATPWNCKSHAAVCTYNPPSLKVGLTFNISSDLLLRRPTFTERFLALAPPTYF